MTGMIITCAVLAATSTVNSKPFILEKAASIASAGDKVYEQAGPVSNLCWGATWASLSIKGKVRFRGGFFAGEKQLSHRGYPFDLQVDSNAQCWIEDVPILTPGIDFRQSQPGEVHLSVAGNQYRDWYVQMGTLVCHARNVLNPDRGLVLW